MALLTDRRTAIHPDALELAEILRPTWPALSAELLLSGDPLCEGDADADKDADKDAAADASKDKDADADKSKDAQKDADADKVTTDDDWKAKSRKNEAAAKRERKAREEAERKLKEREDADKTEQQKLVDAAREEGKAAALTEAEKERRADRLEVAVTRLATKGVTVGEGDDAKTVKFADAEDALLRIERGIRRDEIDADEIYDSEGKVNTDALIKTLAEIAGENPHLIGDGERQKPTGDADARKGEAATKDLEAMSPEDHAKRKYATK